MRKPQVYLTWFNLATVLGFASSRPNEFGPSSSAWIFKQITIFNICGSDASAVCAAEVEDCLAFYGDHLFQPQNAPMRLSVVCANRPFPECLLKISKCTDLLESRGNTGGTGNQESFSSSLSREPALNSDAGVGGLRSSAGRIEYGDSVQDYSDFPGELVQFSSVKNGAFGSVSEPNKGDNVKDYDGSFPQGGDTSSFSGFGHGFVPYEESLSQDTIGHGGVGFPGNSGDPTVSRHDTFVLPTNINEAPETVFDNFDPTGGYNESASVWSNLYGFIGQLVNPSTFTGASSQPENVNEFGSSVQGSLSISRDPSISGRPWQGGFGSFEDPSDLGSLSGEPSDFGPSGFEPHGVPRKPEVSEQGDFSPTGESSLFAGIIHNDTRVTDESSAFERFDQDISDSSGTFNDSGDFLSTTELNNFGDSEHANTTSTDRQIEPLGLSGESLSPIEPEQSDLVFTTVPSSFDGSVNDSTTEPENEFSIASSVTKPHAGHFGDSHVPENKITSTSSPNQNAGHFADSPIPENGVTSDSSVLNQNAGHFGDLLVPETTVTSLSSVLNQNAGHFGHSVVPGKDVTSASSALNETADNFGDTVVPANWVTSASSGLRQNADPSEQSYVSEEPNHHVPNITMESSKFDGPGAVDFAEAADDDKLSILYMCSVRNIPNCQERAAKCSHLAGPLETVSRDSERELSDCLEFMEAFVQPEVPLKPDPPACEGPNCRTCELSLEPSGNFLGKVQACSTVITRKYTLKDCMRSTMEQHIRTVVRAALQSRILSALNDCYQEYSFEQIHGCLVNACAEIV